MAAAPSPGLLSIPVELLHRIFAHLDPEDVGPARLTCGLLAQVGAEHMLEEVVTVYKRDRLQRLVDIAQHPVFSRHVKSFYWQAQRFGSFVGFDEWDRERRDVQLAEETRNERWLEIREIAEAAQADQAAEFAEMNDFAQPTETVVPGESGRHERAKEVVEKWRIRKQGQHSDEAIQKAFSVFKEVSSDEAQIRREGFDTHCLTQLFHACSKLDTVTLSLGHGTKGRVNMLDFAFKDCIYTPSSDKGDMIGVDQFFSLVEALHKSGRSLKSLTVTDVSPRIVPPDMFYDSSHIPSVMRSLYEFRLGLQITEEDVADVDELFDKFEEYSGFQAVQAWLTEAQNLRVLKLNMPTLHGDFGLEVFARIENVFGSLTWPKLRELGLGQFQATEDSLVNLLLRHKNSLRRLSMSHFDLTSGDWTSFFTRMSGKLHKLRKAKLRYIFSEMGQVIHEFDIPGFEDDMQHPVRDAFENMLLHGGDLPDMETLWEPPIHQGEHGQTGREDEEDAGYTTDGSVISYSSDEFDMIV